MVALKLAVNSFSTSGLGVRIFSELKGPRPGSQRKKNARILMPNPGFLYSVPHSFSKLERQRL